MKRTLLKYDEDRPNVISVIFINDENGYVPIVVTPIPFFFYHTCNLQIRLITGFEVEPHDKYRVILKEHLRLTPINPEFLMEFVFPQSLVSYVVLCVVLFVLSSFLVF